MLKAKLKEMLEIQNFIDNIKQQQISNIIMKQYFQQARQELNLLELQQRQNRQEKEDQNNTIIKNNKKRKQSVLRLSYQDENNPNNKNRQSNSRAKSRQAWRKKCINQYQVVSQDNQNDNKNQFLFEQFNSNYYEDQFLNNIHGINDENQKPFKQNNHKSISQALLGMISAPGNCQLQDFEQIEARLNFLKLNLQNSNYNYKNEESFSLSNNQKKLSKFLQNYPQQSMVKEIHRKINQQFQQIKSSNLKVRDFMDIYESIGQSPVNIKIIKKIMTFFESSTKQYELYQLLETIDEYFLENYFFEEDYYQDEKECTTHQINRNLNQNGVSKNLLKVVQNNSNFLSQQQQHQHLYPLISDQSNSKTNNNNNGNPSSSLLDKKTQTIDQNVLEMIDRIGRVYASLQNLMDFEVQDDLKQ